GFLYCVMDDIEKAVLISFDESTSSQALKSQAVAYIHQIKENPLICRICVEKLFFCKLVQVQFWSLQCIHDVLRAKYTSIAPEDKSFIRKSVFSIACYGTADANNDNMVRVLDGPGFIRNKLAQVIVTLIYFEYPSIWPSVFVDFILNLGKGAGVIDMFCRVLSTLDEEIISLEYPRTKDEIVIACRIKDAMRAQCAGQIVSAWYNIVTMYRNSDPELCYCVLDSMKGYIAWVDIGLVVNDAFTKLLFDLMLDDGSPDQLRAASAGVVLAAVLKRMEPKNKLALLQNLQMRRVLSLVRDDSETSLISSVASLLTGYATEVLECSKYLNSEYDKEVSCELLNEVLPSVFYVIQNCEVDSTFSIVQFLSDYVSTMKGLPNLTRTQTQHLGRILELILAKIKYDPAYRSNLDVLDKIGKEEEDRMVDFRKDFSVLLRNVGRVAPDLTHVFIRNSLVNAISSPEEKNVEEVEAALCLFYELGESVSDDALRTGNVLLQECGQVLLSTSFPCHSNRLVALMYLDAITRYLKLLLENNQFIPIALRAFLDERGVCHPNSYVSRRAGYLFMRAVKLLRPKLVPYIETILQGLQDKVSEFTKVGSMPKELPGSEDGSHIFEAIGLLIGMEEVPPEKQSHYLSVLLSPLGQQVAKALLNGKSQNHEESLSHIGDIHQIIVAINALSKGFSPKLVAARPAIALLFKQALGFVLELLAVCPKVEVIRSKVTSFIHRMVEILGDSVFPYLPKAFEQLLIVSEPKELMALLLLLNQLICKFGVAVQGMLEEVYPVIASKIFDAIQKVGVSGELPCSCTEEYREIQELERTFFTFVHVTATHNLSSVFISAKSTGLLQSMMQLLLYSCCNHKDILIRKACVQIFIQFIKDWCNDPPDKEKVPGFRSFVLEAFATNCCLYSVLDKSFDFQDANTLSLFGEILAAQMVMYEKFGEVFVRHFTSKVSANALCPRNFSEEYCQKLQGNDLKGLKSVYQSLIGKLRLQQNGSLIFR
ncbi:hypothetical protein M569_03439, partial [Genlisea aurea]